MTESNDHADPLNRVADLITELGPYARPHRRLLARLATDGGTLADLIKETALPRRVVEDLLRRLGDDLVSTDRLSLRAGRSTAYRQRFGLDRLSPVDDQLDPAGELVATMREIIATAPKPIKAFDHVPATAETVIKRACWLDDSFDLAGGTLLFVGDHDLTSLGICLINPAVRAVVVDIDDRLLQFLDQQAAEKGWPIRTWWADLRFGLPSAVRERADLAFTDPPYTPEGVRLFLARSLQGLRDRGRGRVLLAYGFGSHQPALGLAVQRVITELAVVSEAILPDFNRYDGAQAVGSAADLYRLRPTSGTWPILDRILDRTVRKPLAIYTHGERSVETGPTTAGAAVITELLAAAAGPDPLPVAALVSTERVDRMDEAGPDRVALADALADPAAIRNVRTSAVAVDAGADPGPWLLRILLALSAPRLAIAVANNHPDTTSQAGQQALSGLVGSKWRLRFRRSTPDPAHGIVEATLIDPATLEPGEVVRRAILDGAHRTLENAWRDGLVKAGRRDNTPITKDRARDLIAASPVPPELLASRPIDLPRHRLAALLDTAAATIQAQPS